MDLVASGRVAVGVEIGRNSCTIRSRIVQVGNVGTSVAHDAEVSVDLDDRGNAVRIVPFLGAAAPASYQQ